MMKNKIVHFINGITFSHIMCIAFGILVPIYADVLFFHGYDSSTVSAIMDTVMAIVAVYAAFGVRHWIKDRVKNKGFEHAQAILIDIHAITKKFFDLQANYKHLAKRYMDGGEINQEEHKKFKLESDEIQSQCNTMRDKSLEMLISILGLSSWDMKCNYEKEYIRYMKEIEDARELIEEQLLNLDHDNHIVRLKQWKKFEIKFNEFVVKTSHSYANLDKRFVTAFSYFPPTE
ncbi:hypothetical protein [Raoultella terrigena]|uniref:hypothetical protein n=1 Tax=Raoultella terrigena TaxID=577 RepID=UPI000FBE4DBB|nr:hypothetical protein [Raoultella terrigena]ROS02694.1 hypothetical protein EDF76_0692 [Raoultella terrigena]